jgi:hypothetical protein
MRNRGSILNIKIKGYTEMIKKYRKYIYIFIIALLSTVINPEVIYVSAEYTPPSGYAFNCNNLPLNAGGTPEHYEGGTVCSPYSGIICNICGDHYSSPYCSHTLGQLYGGTMCYPTSTATTKCNICHNNYYNRVFIALKHSLRECG